MNKEKFLDKLNGEFYFYSLKKLEEETGRNLNEFPYSLKILLENLIRNLDGYFVTSEDIFKILDKKGEGYEIPFKPVRILLQDFTGIPLIVDLAAMRSLVKRMGLDPKIINPLVPTDLVIDHSVQVDFYGIPDALKLNVMKEYERNRERYVFLKWAQQAFENLRIVPSNMGIVHQVNLEYLADVIHLSDSLLYPDTLLGTDSHTTMINALGVLGWGVGGIEAEAVMLGQPYYLQVPKVVGVRLVGNLPAGATATDLVLTVTELLRKKNVVDKFVEFFGPGLKNLSLPDRATVANMAPEYGSTIGFFPIDDLTLSYLKLTGRKRVDLIEKYCKIQGLFYKDEPLYDEVIELNLSEVEPCLAGPSNPEDRIPLKEVKKLVEGLLANHLKEDSRELKHGSIVIAAITSCANTSNPHVMIGAGLLARKAVEKGLEVKPYVKTSMAPGSRVVVEYLKKSNLLPYLEKLGFHLVGFGCTTCIGNSGPLPKDVEEEIIKRNLYVASILSGNRNFEGRIHPLVKWNFLASPPLVVAYAIAGRVNWDPYKEPLGEGVYLKDIWPSSKEIQEYIEKYLDPEDFKKEYSKVFEGDEVWKKLEVSKGEIYEWDSKSTYIREPPFFLDFKLEKEEIKDIKGAYVLLLLGDRITTDHISPAGPITKDSPAALYLKSMGVDPSEFNTYGARRGNHEVMLRGAFTNPRLKNFLVDKEGGWTIFIPTGEVMRVYDAAMKYKERGIPLIILAGKQYGAGSSRDWAAKATALLGVKAVIAESFERIHRSNLVGMGVLPLQFEEGESYRSLGLKGFEVYDIEGIAEGISPRKKIKVKARRGEKEEIEFKVTARLDNWVEVDYYKNGGIMNMVLREIIKTINKH